jgi:hypothetical protein
MANGSFWIGADGNVWVAGSDGTNSAGKADANTNQYWQNKGYSPISDPSSTNGSTNLWGNYVNEAPTLGKIGGGSGTGGNGGSAYSQEDLAYLDNQKGVLERQLGRTDSTLANALDAILQNYNKELSGANTTRGRNLEDFDTKTQISESGRGRELGKVDTSARMLADSLRQRLGLASGSGSSAYQITAPRAVQRQASEQRTGVLQDYSANFKALDTDKRRAEEDYNSLLQDLNTQRTVKEGGTRSDIENQRNSIRENLGRVAGQRQQLLGGGYNGVRAAMSPYEQQIAQGESLIDGIYNKYAAKYNVKPLTVNNTQLRDYAVDKAAVRDNQATGNQGDYAPYKPYVKEDDQEVGLV